MSDQDVITEESAQPVNVPQPSVDVVHDQKVEPLVLESPALEVVSVGGDSAIVESVPEVHVVTVGEAGPKGDQGTAGTAAGEVYQAAVSLGGQRVIATNSSGQAIYADNTIAAHADQAARISLGAAAAGNPISVQVGSRITDSSWNWIPGGSIYVGTVGQLTQTPPVSPAVFSKVIAVAETPTRLLMLNEAPVMLA